jgi:hypothetical protein
VFSSLKFSIFLFFLGSKIITHQFFIEFLWISIQSESIAIKISIFLSDDDKLLFSVLELQILTHEKTCHHLILFSYSLLVSILYHSLVKKSEIVFDKLSTQKPASHQIIIDILLFFLFIIL